jgi:hypothetical protein
MVVIIERKKRTRILLKAISKDFPRGSTTCRSMPDIPELGEGVLALVFMAVGFLPSIGRANALLSSTARGGYINVIRRDTIDTPGRAARRHPGARRTLRVGSIGVACRR